MRQIVRLSAFVPIVAVTDMMIFTKPYDYLKVYRDAETEGLKQQVVVYYDWLSLMKDRIGDLTDEQCSSRVKLGGIKLFMDGSMSNRIAWTKAMLQTRGHHECYAERFLRGSAESAHKP